MTRRLDQALAEQRTAKKKVRDLWLEEVNKYRDTDGALYLTLPGAEGLDIELLIRAGVVSVTETGAIVGEDQQKIIAIESNMEAIVKLQRKFPGLKIRESSLENVLNGIGLFAWPTNDIKKDLCARVINIDSDRSLKTKVQQGVSFPLANVVKKISLLHKEPPDGVVAPQTWTLCLTVNSTINWPDQAVKYFLEFLGENCRVHVDFCAHAASLFGDEFVERLKFSPNEIVLQDLDQAHQRQLLCVFIPKLLISEINDHRWTVESCKALNYGGTDGQAPMTTIIMALRISQNNSPARRYEENLRKIVPGIGEINNDGELSFFLD